MSATLQTSKTFATASINPDLIEFDTFLDTFEQTWRADCYLREVASFSSPSRMSSEMRIVGNAWIDCEASLNSFCDRLEGTSAVYLAVDALYPVLPKYRLASNCLLKVVSRMNVVASSTMDPDLKNLILRASVLSLAYYETLQLFDNANFPAMRHGYLIHH